jgi:hypothetical protein
VFEALDERPHAFRHGRTTPARPARIWSVLTAHGLAEGITIPGKAVAFFVFKLREQQRPIRSAIGGSRSDSWSSSGGNCISSGNSGIGSSSGSGGSGGSGASGTGSGRATRGSIDFQPRSLRIVLSKSRIHRLRSCKRSCKYLRSITASSLASRNFAMLSLRLDFSLFFFSFYLAELNANEKKREAREGRVTFRSAWRPAGMSRHNQQRSVEEVRSLLGGTHAMKSLKPSIYIIEGLSTCVNMDASAPHLIHKWLSESRQSPSFMLGGLG